MKSGSYNLFTRFRNAFYTGPEFIGIEPHPFRRRNYQSPTLLIVVWIYAFFVSRLTVAGGILLLCSGLVSLYSLLTLMMPIHLLAFALFALFLVDFILGKFIFIHLRCHREMPERMAAGSERQVRYSLTNTSSRLMLRDISFDTLPLPRGLSLSSGRAFVKALLPGETITATATLRAKRRGRYRLPVMRADTAFPFNLFRRGENGAGSRSLIVYPRFTPLSGIDLIAGMRYQSGGIALSSNVGGSMEFLGCREYRTGDDLRRLHWRSWARVGEPVVREYREEYLCRTALIVDTARPAPMFWERWTKPEDLALEASLSLAASVTDWLASRDFVIDLFAAGPQLYRFQGGRSLGFLENILDLLACVEGHYGEPFAEFGDELVREIAQISGAVFLLLRWDDTRKELIEAMSGAGVAIRVFLVVLSEYAVPADLPEIVEPLIADDILKGRCQHL